MDQQQAAPLPKKEREARGGKTMGMDDVPAALDAPLRWYEGKRRKFGFAVVFTIVGWLGSMVLADLYEKYKPWKGSDDEFVQKIADSQKAQFDSLHASLGTIRASLPSEGREAFDTMKNALTNVERDSAGLVQQLDLAKTEIAAIRAVSVSRGGVGAGYDFTLAEATGMDLAPGALVGVTTVSNDGVRLNLTSGGETVQHNKYIYVGQSLNYAGAKGQQCWISLRSVRDGDPGVASFNAGCPS